MTALNICALVMLGLMVVGVTHCILDESDAKTRHGLGMMLVVCIVALVALALDLARLQ